MDEYGVEPIESVDPTATGNSKRVRRVHVAALAGAVVVLVVAAVFAVQTTMDRGEAERAHRRAVHALQVRRVDTRTAERDLAAAHAEAPAAAVGLTGMLASAQGLVTLADQGLDVARATQAAGATDPIASVDDYNAAVARADAIIDQYNATLDILEQQIATLGNGGATRPV